MIQKTRPPNAGRGRKVGAKNKIPREVGKLIAAFVAETSEAADVAWRQLLKKNPARALEIRLRAAELVLTKNVIMERPELQRPIFGISFQDGGPGLPVVNREVLDNSSPRNPTAPEMRRPITEVMSIAASLQPISGTAWEKLGEE